MFTMIMIRKVQSVLPACKDFVNGKIKKIQAEEKQRNDLSARVSERQEVTQKSAGETQGVMSELLAQLADALKGQ